jgi:hypothetical protein
MAAETAGKIDAKTLQEAIAWSLHYLLDPKRGKGVNIPTDDQLEEKFPKSNITRSLIEFELKNLFGVKSVSEIERQEEKVREVIQKEQQNPQEVKKAATPLVLPKVPGGKRVSGLGVLAELETVEPLLRKHRLQAQENLAQSLDAKVRQILPSLGIKSTNEEQFLKIVNEVARETARQALEDVGRIEVKEQIPEVVADSLTQTIINHPDLESQISLPPEEVFQKVYKSSEEISRQHEQPLEQAAALGNLAQIAKLEKPNQDIKNRISQSAQNIVEAESALGGSGLEELVKSNLGLYLKTYTDELKSQLARLPQDKIPTLEEVQKAKDEAHKLATGKTSSVLSGSESGRRLKAKIDPANITAPFAQNFFLSRAGVPSIVRNLPAGSTIVFSKKEAHENIISAALAHDQEWLAKEMRSTNVQLEDYKRKRSLSFKDKKRFSLLKNYYGRLTKAQADYVKKKGRLQGLTSLLAKPLNGNILPFSQTVQALIKSESGYIAPQTLLYGQKFAADILLRRSQATLGLNLGIEFSLPKIPSFGMGKTVGTKLIAATAAASIGSSILKKVIKIGGSVLGGLGLYFLGLAQAAFVGFLIGATVGGVAGAIAGVIIGAQVGAAIGSVVPFFGTAVGAVLGGAIGGAIGFFTGATIGGIAGGLLGWGIASNSTVATTTGAGTAIGATVGFIFGGPVGAVLGAFIGAGIGYLVGKFAIPFAKSAFNTLTSGAAGAGTSVVSTIGGLISSAISTVVNLGSSIIGGAFGFVSSATGFFVGPGLSTLGFNVTSAGAAALPTAAAVGTVTVTGAFVGIVTATTFFTLATDEPTGIQTPGENEFFSLTKTAEPKNLNNSDLPADIKFTISLEAKVNLTNIQITDDLKVQKQSGTFTVTTDKDGKAISPPCAETIPADLSANQTWTCEIIITASNQPPERDFSDSVVANTVTVKATPEGQTEITDYTTTTAIIGTPPALCSIFNIQGSWSQTERENLDQVCQVLDTAPTIVALLRNAGTIDVVKGGTRSDGVCGTVTGARVITIYCDISSLPFAKYVMIHELGHVLGNFNGVQYQAFLDSGAFQTEGLMPTYPFDVSAEPGTGPNESFAEMITEYVVSKEYNHLPRSWSGYPGGPWVNPGPGWTTFKNDRSIHYNFAKNEIYGGVEF